MKKQFLKILSNLPFYRYFMIFFMNKLVVMRLQPFYKNEGESICRDSIRTILYMADGKIRSGGLADRFRGMVSVYKLCLEWNLNYKINFSEPFELESFLSPNEYDWRIDKKDIIYNKKNALPVFITSTSSIGDEKVQKYFAQKYFFKKDYSQIHLFTNMYVADKEYGILFKRLFKPTRALEELINQNLKDIGENYISIVFRFQQLLGDFKEGDYPELSEIDKINFISDCINLVKAMYNEHRDKFKKILVTSDSITFLNSLTDIPFVYIIPGEIAHPDYPSGSSSYVYMKSFVDYYMLSYSKKIYLARNPKMYHSGFAQRAAMLNNVPYCEIDI